MAEILEALQVKHADGNAGVSFKLPKPICSKYFDGMDYQMHGLKRKRNMLDKG